jgi:aryl-alcohol dehydrogenase-like predicted oxidoreductase
MVDAAFDLGIRFFDTANLYGNGESERLLGRALRGRREQVGIATKVGLAREGNRPEGLSPLRLKAALEASLSRLGTDYLDLYYLHAPDPSTPLEQTLDALQPLLEAGTVRAFGLSNFASWRILEVAVACQARGMAGPSVSQVLYNLLVRQLEVEYFAFARHHPVHTTVYNPLAGGLLARTGSAADPIPPGSRFARQKLYQRRYWSAPSFELADRYRQVAHREGTDLISLAYAWLAGTPGVDSILTGPATLAHLEAAIAGCQRSLSPEARARIAQIHLDFLGSDACYARE